MKTNLVTPTVSRLYRRLSTGEPSESSFHPRLIKMNVILTASAFLLAGILTSFAQTLQPIPLPKPQTDIGRPLMQVLKDRQTIREFSTEKVPLQKLSNLLWAGFGINRATNAHRTAPSAMNSQEIDIYVASAEGLYLYDAAAHQLKPVLAGDIRSQSGSQPFMKDAPLSLVFVADYSRLTKAKPEEKEFYAAIDTGFISQNIYLYCASEGLATVIHMAGDRAALSKTMRLKPEQKIVIAQAVGVPKAAK